MLRQEVRAGGQNSSRCKGPVPGDGCEGWSTVLASPSVWGWDLYGFISMHLYGWGGCGVAPELRWG